MPSALELLIFTGVARRTKGRVRASQRGSAPGFFFLGKYRGRRGFDNLVTFGLGVVKVVGSMVRTMWAFEKIDLKEYYIEGLEEQQVV